jgi:pyruvate kinase
VRRTRIVATLGPATRDADTLRALVEAGVDVVRLNAAHDRAEVHATTAATVRA